MDNSRLHDNSDLKRSSIMSRQCSLCLWHHASRGHACGCSQGRIYGGYRINPQMLTSKNFHHYFSNLCSCSCQYCYNIKQTMSLACYDSLLSALCSFTALPNCHCECFANIQTNISRNRETGRKFIRQNGGIRSNSCRTYNSWLWKVLNPSQLQLGTHCCMMNRL